MHASNGNIVWYPRRTPPPRNYLWAQSIYLNNGMCLFRYSFYGKESLWIYASRRGSSFEIETTKRESPTLYGIVCKAVASRGGGPGDRWHIVKSHDRMWHARGTAPSTYGTNHLRYDMPCGYQHREAHGGNSKRGIRSQEAYDRRKDAWKFSRQQGRRDYRIWKSSVKDSTMRVHGGPNPQPPIHPKPTYTERFRKFQARLPISSHRVHVHHARSATSRVSVPLPTRTDIHLLTWNVEGLRESTKYDAILSFCKLKSVSILCAQETKAESSHFFVKNGWEILMSGLPSDKHHGVGFFVSPHLRVHTSNFIPHSPRIAEITIHTLPHPITVLNVYAPSMVEDPDKDRERKAEFWTQLEEIVASHSNIDHLMLVGDFNARLDSALDRDQLNIGPAVIGQRISVPDIERDNAVYFLDFLQANNFSLPQTYSDLAFKKKVSYKEMSCTDPLISGQNIQDWTVLDYAAVPPKIKAVLTFSGNLFQQLINSRHLPLSFHIRTKFLPIAHAKLPPKKDFRSLASYYDRIESALLDKADNSFAFTSPPANTLVAYTDGSCPNNRVVSFDNPAGWGFVYTLGHTGANHPPAAADWTGSWGPVKSEPQSIEGLSVGSNNTGELRAVIELFDFLLCYAPLNRGDLVVVYMDSSYVLDLLQGSSLPTTHPQLVSLAQQYYTAARIFYRLRIQKVPGHHGVPGNEMADLLAKKGVTSTGSVGRYMFSPSRPLQPPEIGFNSHTWNSISVQEQDEFIVSQLSDNMDLVPVLPLAAKKPWISAETLQLISELQEKTYETVDDLKRDRKIIKKAARKDKKLFISRHLEDDFHGTNIHQWDHAKSIRSPFKPKAAALYNTQGKLVSRSARAQTFADYLAEKIWYLDADPGVPVTAPSPAVEDMNSPFTMHELNLALRKLKSAKAPGPNGLVGDIYEHAPYILRMYLLDHYNLCFATKQVPPSWLFSEVVMIVKNYQKDTRSLFNDRPISLTNISYKLFASMIQSRLSHYLDERIRPTEFGFRKSRSTTQPVHILRRLLEVHERQPSPFHALFLDWSKAFDSVTFSAIKSAMEFMGVSEHVVQVVMSLYQSPKFVVRDAQQISGVKTQTKGLRQGCPLSPYLFSMVLTHLFHDVELTYEHTYGMMAGVINTPSPLWDLEYADDTVFLSNSAEQLNRLLHLIQYEGKQRGLILNEDKCEHLKLNSDSKTFYAKAPYAAPCTCEYCTGNTSLSIPVPNSSEVKYLGVFLSTTGSKKNVSYRISQAMQASKLLKPLLAHSSLPPSWKLTVYRSIVQAILMYAMDSELLSQSQLTRLNAVHFKAVRRIFKIKTSYYHRVIEPSDAECSNEYLAGLSFRARQVVTPSQIYSHDRLRLFGHILRHTDSLEFHSSFMPSGAYKHTQGPNRLGRPRLHWAESCMVEANNRIHYIMSDSPPSHSDIHNSYFEIPTAAAVRVAHAGQSLVWMDKTLLYRQSGNFALNRKKWSDLLHKPKRA